MNSLCKFAALVIGFTGWASPSLAAECQLQFTAESATIRMNVSQIRPGEVASGEELIGIEKVGPQGVKPGAIGECGATLRVARLSLSPDFPQYRLNALGSNLAPIISDGGSNLAGEVSINLPVQSVRRAIPMRAVSAIDWSFDAGQYTERLELSLVDLTGEVVDRLTLDILLDVSPSVDAIFVGATGTDRATSINLGQLSQTAETRSSPFGVRVWANTTYQFRLSSENSGQLRHMDGGDFIPYNLAVDGLPVSLNGRSQPISSARRSILSGDLYRLLLSVPARRSLAGEYRDRLLVTVTAL